MAIENRPRKAVSVIVKGIRSQSRIADVIVKRAVQIVRATLGDDVCGKCRITSVLRAEMVRLNVELLNGIERHVHRGRGHHDIVALRAIKKIVRTLSAPPIDGKSDAETVFRESCARHYGDK